MRVFVPCFVLALLLSLGSARAATLAQVDAEISKANKSLQSMAAAGERAKTLTAAVESLHGALELLAKVDGLTPEQIERKSTDITSTIFWCKKMMPLDLSGRSLNVATGGENKGPSEQKGGEAAAAKAVGPELDELAFNRSKEYAAKNVNDLQGILLRYDGVAASYQHSQWGQRAAQEANQVRAKLEQMRAASLKALAGKIQKLELAEALAVVEKNLDAEQDAARKLQLAQTKTDVEALQALKQRVITLSAARFTPFNASFEDLGVNKKGFIKTAKADGVAIGESKDGSAGGAPLAWSDFGARSLVRLAEKFFPLGDGDTLEQLCIGATVAEDYVAAERLFGRLLTAAPERVTKVASYFERMQSGYKVDAEASARTRLKDIKELVRKRAYTEAMPKLTALQGELAQNSTLQLFLAEVDLYRRTVRKDNALDDAGNPITPFEKSVRRIFSGDVKLDEKTGALEALYDLSNTEQMRDWLVADSFDKPSTKIEWSLVNGRAECAGGRTMLQWKYPVSNLTLTADVTYTDTAHRVCVHSTMSKDDKYGVTGWCIGGAAFMNGWFCDVRYIRRPGEVATLCFVVKPGDQYPQQLLLNGHWVIAGRCPIHPGAVGFSFDGGKGTVDNVHIQGTLDMAWFKQVTAGMR